jgi:hypothetical protein
MFVEDKYEALDPAKIEINIVSLAGFFYTSAP